MEIEVTGPENFFKYFPRCNGQSNSSLNDSRFIKFLNFTFFKIKLLGCYARVVNHLAVRNVAQGAPLWGGLAKITDCPRRKAVAEFRLCVGHDCLESHLHRIGIRPNPYCMLCSLHETMDRNRLGRCTALSSGTDYERYWEARTQIMGNWLLHFYLCDYSLLGALCLFWMFLMFFLLLSVVFIMELLIFYFYWSHRSMINNQCTRVGNLIVATIYLQLIQNRYMFRSFTLLQCSHQHCVQPVASDMEVVGYL